MKFLIYNKDLPKNILCNFIIDKRNNQNRKIF